MTENNQKDNKTQENQKHGSGSESEKKSSFGRFVKKYPVLFTVLVALFIVLIVFIWKDWEGNRKRQEVIKSATVQLYENKQEMLSLLCKPLVWCIRAEMLRGNMEQVDIFISDLVKETNFLFIHLVDPSGVVILSTDKKLEGLPAGEGLDASLLTVESASIHKNGEELIVAAPVMGYDRRLATLIFTYQNLEFVP